MFVKVIKSHENQLYSHSVWGKISIFAEYFLFYEQINFINHDFDFRQPVQLRTTEFQDN